MDTIRDKLIIENSIFNDNFSDRIWGSHNFPFVLGENLTDRDDTWSSLATVRGDVALVLSFQRASSLCNVANLIFTCLN